MTVSPGSSTVAFIRKKVRRLTASSGASTLTTAIIDEYINNFLLQDFAYAIKLDQMRSVYTFYSQPYIDRYPVDVNYVMGFRSPAYVEGIRASFYKERDQFYNLWPRFPTQFLQSPEAGSFSFTLPGPFLSKEVTIGATNASGTVIRIADDGNGILQVLTPNTQTSVPTQMQTPTAPIPGMLNQNTGNPGLNSPKNVGTVNYVTGVFTIDFATAGITIDTDVQMNIWVSQYQVGRPYSMLFWNNEMTIRPVPDNVYKCEIECYLTPVQFMLTTDTPILNQWAQYIAYGAACEILRDRQDFDGLNQLMEGFKRQEELVLERQGVEEIGTPTTTFFNSSQQTYVNSFWGLGGPF